MKSILAKTIVPPAVEWEKQHFDQLFEWFDQLEPLVPPDREAVYAKLGNPALEEELRRMLGDVAAADAAFDRALLEHAAAHIPAAVASPDYHLGRGQVLGDYVVEGVLGEGGFGVVYKVESRDKLHMEKAAKMLKYRWNDLHMARFKDEDRTLAALNHPNIVRVESTNITDDGYPYFIMPFIEGVAITDFCRGRLNRVEDRLDLFLALCEGVQHAHQRGIIHRDLKPSNILVTCPDDKPMPRIIDFGIASEVKADRDEAGVSEISGTPPYMSPEQTRGEAADTRADIYSLGVILYEMLTDVPFFDQKEVGDLTLDQKLHQVQTRNPLRPSRRISVIAGTAATGLSAAEAKKINYELDAIILKAVAKAADDRYRSVSEMTADIHRYLRKKSVLAVGGGPLYDLKNFVRRHKIPTLATILGIVALMVGLVVALDQKRTSDALNDLLLGIMIMPNPAQMGGEVRLLDALLAAEPTLHITLANHPLKEIRLRYLMADSLMDLGEHQRSRQQYEKLLILQKKHKPNMVPVTLGQIAQSHIAQKQYREAEQVLRDALGSALTLLGPNDETTLEIQQIRGRLRVDQGRPESAVDDILETLQIQNNLKHHPAAIRQSQIVLADAYAAMGRNREADDLYNQILQAIDEKERKGAMIKQDRVDQLYVMKVQSKVWFNAGRHDEALIQMKTCVKEREQIYGDKHPSVFITKLDLAVMLLDSNQLVEAQNLSESVYFYCSSRFGVQNLSTLEAQVILSYILKKSGKLQDSVDIMNKIVAHYQTIGRALHPMCIETQVRLADALYKMGHCEEALVQIKTVGALAEDHELGSQMLLTLICTQGEVELCLQITGNHEVPRATFEKGLDLALRHRSNMIPVFNAFIAKTYFKAGAFQKAKASLERAFKSLEEYPQYKSFVIEIDGELRKMEESTL